MILPGSSLYTLILLAIALLCWGSWANSLKAAGKWRFELFYYDFAVGAVLAAVLIGFTFGSMGLDGFTVMDDLKLGGKRQDAFAFGAGCIFNLGNILLVAAASLAGLSTAFPIGLGVALIVSVLVGRFTGAQGSVMLALGGCAALLAAVVFDAVAWSKYRTAKAREAQTAAAALAAEQAAQGLTATPTKKKPSRRKASTRKAVFLAVLGGLLSGLYSPLIGMAQESENGIGPYTVALLFAVGVAFSTFVYNLFFMNLPIQGAAIEVREYFNGKVKQHAAGMAGGAIWCVGLVAALVAARADAAAAVPAPVAAGITMGAPVLTAVWGMALWKEFADTEGNIKLLMWAMMALFATGVAAIAVAPTFGAR